MFRNFRENRVGKGSKNVDENIQSQFLCPELHHREQGDNRSILGQRKNISYRLEKKTRLQGLLRLLVMFVMPVTVSFEWMVPLQAKNQCHGRNIFRDTDQKFSPVFTEGFE